MGKQDTKELKKCLEPFKKDRVALVWWLRDFAWDLCPEANELIYDNYNAIAFGWSPTEKVSHTVCSIAIMRSNQNIHFGFYWGSELKDPKKLLLGKGNQYRYLLVKNEASFPKAYVTELVNEAYVNSLSKVKDKSLSVKGQTLVKSISEKKREMKP
ncbi:MAG TPA: hypothetical protein PKW08_13310 [Flavobacteriaceae bacterium]|nr:hypothetical protein [Flavobacteriaceae bacterium]MCB9213739.1 hypothetical protein [Alteromonas sp.]HPF12541.1 hypothetical protein [Flavobacteriaceae bacterium]HQU22560.1 hypothetical protein [Flavobacteriaceae bacterium]HQU66352.1 hypothetical protein [Flavobacteriaceae bacterium]